MKLYIWLVLLLYSLYQPAAAQSEQVLTGTLNADQPTVEFSTRLTAGAVLVAVTRSPLDTVLVLNNSNDMMIAANNDANLGTGESALAVRIPQDDRYTIVVTSTDPATQVGDFELRLRIGDESLLATIEPFARVAFSGPQQIRDTRHFRIHYTETGADAAPAELVEAVATTLEATWEIAIEQMGWPPPPPDVLGGDDRYDVYLAPLPGPDGFSLGLTGVGALIVDNPHTVATEQFAAHSFMIIANDFNINRADWQDLLRTTIAHEFAHALELGHDALDWHAWYYEATATWMETAIFTPHATTLNYAATSLQYPALCLGTREERAGNGLDYGNWLLMQALVDQYDPAIMQQLWASIAVHEGFDGLIQLLATYNQPFADFVLRYHAQRLTRNITFMDQLEETVKISQHIDATGHYASVNSGVQELGVDYITLALPPNHYTVRLATDLLEVWAIGIRNDAADVYALDRNGIIDTTDYDHVYLLVFNPQPAADPTACQYQPYELDIATGTGESAMIAFTLDATNFIVPD